MWINPPSSSTGCFRLQKLAKFRLKHCYLNARQTHVVQSRCIDFLTSQSHSEMPDESWSSVWRLLSPHPSCRAGPQPALGWRETLGTGSIQLFAHQQHPGPGNIPLSAHPKQPSGTRLCCLLDSSQLKEQQMNSRAPTPSSSGLLIISYTESTKYHSSSSKWLIHCWCLSSFSIHLRHSGENRSCPNTQISQYSQRFVCWRFCTSNRKHYHQPSAPKQSNLPRPVTTTLPQKQQTTWLSTASLQVSWEARTLF